MAEPISLEALIRRAQSETGIEDRETLLREAVEELLAREARRHLAAMGGQAPDYEPGRRQRLEPA